jgi:hypothetical protein
MTLDEELAEQTADAEAPADMPKVRMSEYSPELERLTDLLDRLGELISTVAAAGGAKHPPRVKPAPRPVLASARVRARRRVERHHRLVARVLPDTARTP